MSGITDHYATLMAEKVEKLAKRKIAGCSKEDFKKSADNVVEGLLKSFSDQDDLPKSPEVILSFVAINMAFVWMDKYRSDRSDVISKNLSDLNYSFAIHFIGYEEPQLPDFFQHLGLADLNLYGSILKLIEKMDEAQRSER